jgi:hypothetical protein
MIDIFKDKAFDVEQALSMYAKSFVQMPAFLIYEDEQIAPVLDQIRHCHIYMIGLTPKVVLLGAVQKGWDLVTSFEAASKRYYLRWPMPAAMALKGDDETGWWVEDAPPAQNRFRAWPTRSSGFRTSRTLSVSTCSTLAKPTAETARATRSTG